MRYYVLLLWAGLLLAACGAKPATAPDTATETTMPDGARFLALGDSYTIGESVAEGERWPVQLAALLRRDGIACAAPEIVARTGWTTDELSAAMDARTFEPPYDLVSLLIGVNNQYRGYELDGYRAEFDALLHRAIALAGGDPAHVLVLSIPDWGVTHFAAGYPPGQIAAEIDRFNAVNRELTARAAALYVDITPGSRLAAADDTLIAGDFLHPSGKQYALWAEAARAPAGTALAAFRTP